MTQQKKVKQSFRDPCDQLREEDDRIFRILSSQGDLLLSLFKQSKVIANAREAGEFISHQKVKRTQDSIILEHPKIWFPNYPYEWSYGMLLDAVKSTNLLALSLLSEGLGLKDATPYSILFQGPTPIIVDIASIEKRESKDAIWKPFSQFTGMFLLPLLIIKEFGMELSQIYLSYAKGLSINYCTNLRLAN